MGGVSEFGDGVGMKRWERGCVVVMVGRDDRGDADWMHDDG